MMERRAFLAAGAAFAALPLRAQPLRFSVRGAMEQGSLCVGTAEPGARVSVDGQAVRVSANGVFTFGFAYDQTKPALVEAHFADGTVTIADAYFLDGNFTLIDHGQGVSTCYLHQSELRVKVGDRVTRGQLIGLMGQTGRATGPNLHWALGWFDVKLDPSRSTRTPLPPKLDPQKS